MNSQNKKKRAILFAILGVVLVAAVVVAAITVIPKMINNKTGDDTTPMPSTETPLEPMVNETPDGTESEAPTSIPSTASPETETPEVLVELPKPENPSEADDYLWDSAKVYKITDVKESENVKSEKEALAIFTERGFTQCPTEYDFTMDGEYVGEMEASAASQEKHPRYFTFFVSESGYYFRVYLIDDIVMAYPISLILDAGLSIEVLISESDKVMSYDPIENKYYLTTPNGTNAIVKTIERIDADLLNALTKEDLIK